MAGMTRRELSFLAIGLGFSGIIGSFVVAYQYARNVSDWRGVTGMGDVLDLHVSAFIVPAVILVAGLALLLSAKK